MYIYCQVKEEGLNWMASTKQGGRDSGDERVREGKRNGGVCRVKRDRQFEPSS